MKKITVIFLILFIMNIYNVSSLGITGNRLIEFVPNLTASFPLCITNTKTVDQDVKITVSGELEEYITLQNYLFELGPGERTCPKYTVNLPESFDRPGIHSSYISAKEVLEESDEDVGGLIFNIIVEVKHRFDVRVPDVGKFLEVSLNFGDIKENEEMLFKIVVISSGTETIENVRAKIDVYKSDILIASLTTDEAHNLGKRASATLKAVWDTKGTRPGDYKAVVTVTFDEKQQIYEKVFRIGTLKVDIINYTKQFYNGSVNRFDLEVESKWNDPIENLFVEVKIWNERFSEKIKTSQETIKPWRRKTITSFLDLRNIGAGNYSINITLFYENKTTTEIGKVEVFERKEILSPFLNTTTYLISIIILIIIFDIIWFIRRRKR